MRNIAVIPARSGSKGLKDKNIRLLKGKPLIAYSIEAALESKAFECVHLSTDSEIYAEIGRACGADVPFLRDAELSSDTATTWDTMRYIISRYKDIGQEFDTLTILQPTSPLRTSEDIKAAYQIYKDKSAKSVIGVCEVDHAPEWCNVIPEDGCLQGFLSKATNVQRQKLPTYYRINGAMYMIDVELLMENGDIYGTKSFAYPMSKWRSVDIDDEMDFLIAETIMNHMK